MVTICSMRHTLSLSKTLVFIISISIIFCFINMNEGFVRAADLQDADRSIDQVNNIESLPDLIFQTPNQDEKVVYLTFDDGPTPHTELLLNMLDQYEAKATFFLLAPNMEKYPHIVTRMMNDNFGVGLHGVTHDPRIFYRSKEHALGEMLEAQRVLKEITGEESDMIRTPYGSFPYFIESYRKEIKTYGFEIWDWHVDSLDWEYKNDEYVDKTIEQIEQLANRGIHPVVLLHDRRETIQYLPKLLSYLKTNNYTLKTLDQSREPVFFECKNRCYKYGSKKKRKQE